MHIVIMRGIPGSGKSPFVTRLMDIRGHAHTHVISTDKYTQGPNGYDPSMLQAGHEASWLEYEKLICGEGASPKDLVVVDNTNITGFEIGPYYLPARAHKHFVSVVTMLCSPEDAIVGSTHKVPSSVIWPRYQTLVTERLPAYVQGIVVVQTYDEDDLPVFDPSPESVLARYKM